MFVVSFMTFMAIGGFPSFVEDMKIFGRERLNGHYGKKKKKKPLCYQEWP
ncbi:hypothetical protein Syun_015373 [Stephania yunnanensis]|uniref:Uncharacterized protein n=1 Tax=Stephania yunnanensis TaxID=152371 RepID=A0AAP0P9A8_9MAGN